MNATLKKIFETNSVEINSSGERVPLHSNTPLDQCLFIQEMFDKVKPKRSLEIGLAYGISALSILEKHRELNSLDKCHVIVEPYPWNGVAEYNIEKEGLSKYCDFRYKTSDWVVTELFRNNETIQFAYVDTTKVVDIVMQDFYFIDKILEVGGIVVFDDCGGGWPGVQKVARFVNTLPHYKVIGRNGKREFSKKHILARNFVKFLVSLIPYKHKFYEGYSFKNNNELGLDWNCIAFQKINKDERKWDWDQPW